jgi:hypothetical protein
MVNEYQGQAYSIQRRISAAVQDQLGELDWLIAKHRNLANALEAALESGTASHAKIIKI